ncbi:hypothetical protein CTO_1006 [Chlamydia trachomatis A2497]|uniref:Uncharacterized protein n=1 Tax=Chlamydia trachomatis serovar A (strain A2497) TaxID=580047 RepID=G4NNT6_CHLT4|nr:hypothetical protein CTO_1006 [Chlamydia trachomatis A2497]
MQENRESLSLTRSLALFESLATVCMLIARAY